MIEFIKTIAENASVIMMKHFRNLDFADFKMKALMDPVTIADTEIENLVIKMISDRFPDHKIMAEESCAETRSDGPLWIIDPLDGTNNYLHGIPNHCISIAYVENGIVEVALVCAPALGETYTAVRGEGAFLNDKPVTVSEFATLEQSMLCTGYADLRKYEDGTNLKVWDVIARKVSGIRRYGSAALDLCWLASGRYDGFWERDLSPWDIAAGSLIVQEAGGIIVNITCDTTSDGTCENSFSTFDGSIIATNQKLAETVQHLVRDTISVVRKNSGRELSTPDLHPNNPQQDSSELDPDTVERDTSDSVTTVLELKKDMEKFVSERDWDQFHNPKNLAMSISIEAAELMEIFQWKNNDEAVELMKDEKKYHHAKEELSDILAYALSMANVLNIDIGKAFREKMKKNAKKYPIDKVYGKWAD